MKQLLLIAAPVALLACAGDATGTIGGGSGSSLQVLNATLAPLTIRIDGVLAKAGLGVTALSSTSIAPGTHTVRLETEGAVANELTITAVQGIAVTAIVQASIEGDLLPNVLDDTAATPAAGKTKIRVIHMAASAPAIDFWRTQPDFATPTRVMFPFPYLAESSYIQSDAGTWTVFVTTTTDATAHLADSGPIVTTSGQVRTVVLVDSAGVLKFRITNDR